MSATITQNTQRNSKYTQHEHDVFDALVLFVDPLGIGHWDPEYNEPRPRLTKHKKSELSKHEYFVHRFSPRDVHERNAGMKVYGLSPKYASVNSVNYALTYLDCDNKHGETDINELKKFVIKIAWQKYGIEVFVDSDDRLYVKWKYTKQCNKANEKIKNWVKLLRQDTADYESTLDFAKFTEGTFGRLPALRTSESLERWNEATINDLDALTLPRRKRAETTNIRKLLRGAAGGSSGSVGFTSEAEAREFIEILNSPRIDQLRNYTYAMCPNVLVGEKRITREDFAIAITLESYKVHTLNEDCANPYEYTKEFWDLLYMNRIIERGFDSVRWARIWETLVDCGLLDEIDCRYWTCDDKAKSKCRQYKGNSFIDYDSLVSLLCKEEKTILQEVISYPAFVECRFRGVYLHSPDDYLPDLEEIEQFVAYNDTNT